jgi:Tfp pilus assembly protein FimT
MELLIVMALAGILMLVSLPALGTWLRSNRVRSATNVLVTHVRLTRSAAISGSGTELLNVAGDGLSYTYPDTRGTTRTYSLPEGVSVVTASPDPLGFRPNGTLDGVTSATLEVQGVVSDGNAHRYTIALSKIGKVSVTKSEVTP